MSELEVDELLVPRSPSSIDLERYDPKWKAGLGGKHESRKRLDGDAKRLSELHDVFATQTKHALLIVLQGMDTAGKDGIIKHVMSGMNPQGVDVVSFRQPTEEERRHDFLWRESKVLPARGRIAIFNRSYYEEVLVVRVQPALLASEDQSRPCDWNARYEDINAFERHLARSGTIVLKFFLHISKDEQRKRLLARLENPEKMWKASDADLEGHQRWDDYVAAYREMLEQTSTEWAPWYVVPSDRKWVARAVVAAVVVDALEKLDLRYPEPTAERRERYARLAERLKSEAE
ncbi:MAG: polyphosphate kinase 2 family protein [Candidatus Eremiobacteraeota bacterium]|nr:polyphosphate kinase 2 family protein [Candidatus Eremiobacteraeota bacterium]